jgi:cytoplasmic iron level regulating protein YaaA (DUF328/UPF0246 family)
MQPYRLEMGTTLKVGRPNNLYQYWQKIIAPYLNERLQGDAKAAVNEGQQPVVINLASQEYFKAVDVKALNARVVECVFEDFKSGQYKIISFNAKRARGLMARFGIQGRAATPEQLQGFDAEGWAFAPAESAPDRLVFRRQLGV